MLVLEEIRVFCSLILSLSGIGQVELNGGKKKARIRLGLVLKGNPNILIQVPILLMNMK